MSKETVQCICAASIILFVSNCENILAMSNGSYVKEPLVGLRCAATSVDLRNIENKPVGLQRMATGDAVHKSKPLGLRRGGGACSTRKFFSLLTENDTIDSGIGHSGEDTQNTGTTAVLDHSSSIRDLPLDVFYEKIDEDLRSCIGLFMELDLIKSDSHRDPGFFNNVVLPLQGVLDPDKAASLISKYVAVIQDENSDSFESESETVSG